MDIKSLELDQMGLIPVAGNEVQDIYGGGFWKEVAKAIGIEAMVEAAKDLGAAAVKDWKSCDGSPRSMTDTYVSFPLH